MSDITPVFARILLRDMLSRGIAESVLFAGTNLDRPQLDTGGDIPMGDFTTLLDNARRASGDETLGLIIGRHSSVVALGPVGGAAAVAPTVRAGLLALESFNRLSVAYSRVELISGLDGLTVRMSYLEPLGAVESFHAETGIMLIQNYIEATTGEELNDARYHLGFPRPGYAAEYDRWFHSPVSFGGDVHSVEIPRHWLDRRSPYYHAEAWTQARYLLGQKIQELGDSQAGAYSQHLRAVLKSHEPPLPDLASVAAGLHLSGRTLNRRLQREGTSFRAIRGELLRGWARQYLLETDHSVEAIAALLGYQDSANFRRAFRNWEQCSPREFRGSASGLAGDRKRSGVQGV